MKNAHSNHGGWGALTRWLLLGWLTIGPGLVGAQNFAVDRFALSGGGGTSTNGGLRVVGSMAQPDAAPRLVGGSFAVDSGFWSVVSVVQTPGAPLLSLLLVKASGTWFFSWPLSDLNYTLESSPVLGPLAIWTSVSEPVQTGVQYRFALLPPMAGQRYFRLRQNAPSP